MFYNPLGYIINTIIRRIIYLLINKKTLKILIIVALILGWLFISTKLGSYAYAYDYNYVDPTANIYTTYEGFINKAIILIENSSASNKQELINLLKNSNYLSYFYFGTAIDGASPSSDASQLNVGFIPCNNLDFTLSTQYTSYFGIPVLIYSANNPYRIYSINSTQCWYATGYNFYAPKELIFYSSGTLVNWLNDYSTSQNNSIVNAIDTQTTAINQQTNTIQATQDYLEDDNVSDNTMSVDTSQMAITDDTGIDNFWTTYLTNLQTRFQNFDESSISYLTIPLPYGLDDLVIPSNIISSHLKSGTFRTLINVFWTYLFGSYIVWYAYRMIIWLTSGKVFEEGGVSRFISEMSKQNEIIKGFMM